jgi:D-glycero-D-manno-heptose 1,7-bisphosphate phosphatase
MIDERRPLRPAAFLDRDGVINVDRGYVVRREDFELVPGFLDGARRLRELGYAVVVITNQSGIGRGLYTEQDFNELTDWMMQALADAGVELAGVFFCPHHPTEASGTYRTVCECRKPAPGLLLRAAEELGLDLPASVMFGDRSTDLQAARAAGLHRRVLLATNGVGTPELDIEPGLATDRFTRLDEAVGNGEFLASLKTLAPSV